MPGLVSYSELVVAGVIPHAIRFTVHASQAAYLTVRAPPPYTFDVATACFYCGLHLGVRNARIIRYLCLQIEMRLILI